MNIHVSTVEELEQAVNKLDGTDVVIVLEEGRYHFSRGLVMENVKNVKFKASGGKVLFDGGVVIPTDRVKPLTDTAVLDRIIEKDAHSHLVEIDLSGMGIVYASYGNRGFRRPYVPAPNELFADGRPMIVAGYPKEGNPMIPLKTVVDSGSSPYDCDFSRRPGIIKYEGDRPSYWTKAKDLYISGLFNWSYADDTLEVAEINAESRIITTKSPHLAGFKASSYTAWRAINLLEEISCPGEYYVDKEKDKIYFFPPRDFNSSLLQLSVLGEPMVSMYSCENVTFEGIVFENSRGTGCYIEGGRNCLLKDCVFHNLGMLAVQIGQGATPLIDGLHNAHGIQAEGIDPPKPASGIVGSWHEMLYQYAAWNNNGGCNNGIDSCVIHDTGTGGVLLGGGDRKSLTPAGNFVHNCEITRVNRLDKTYKAGVNICGVGNRVSKCDIYDLSGFAVYIHGNDHCIEYNRIHDVIKEVADAGAIYIGRDLSEVGNIIRYNFIYDIIGSIESHTGICAVYFDDYSSFNEVYGNYFFNICQAAGSDPFGVVFWNLGCQTSVSNNVFIDCPVTLKPNFNGAEVLHKLLNAPWDDTSRLIVSRAFAKEDEFVGVDITSEVYQKRYPYLYQLYDGTYVNRLMYYNNLTFNNESRCFIDYDKRDFTYALGLKRLEYTESLGVYDVVRSLEDERVPFKIVEFKKIGNHFKSSGCHITALEKADDEREKYEKN